MKKRILKSATIAFGIGIALTGGSNVQAANTEKISAVIELYTSQGCSSCPPADKLIGKLAKRDDLLVLTLPVDYWDYLGWKDTLASPENTRRQRSYATVLDERSIYTPQVVISGKSHEVGSNESAINQAISKFSPLPVELNVSLHEENINVEFKGSLPIGVKSASVLLIGLLSSKSVQIDRGENHGREITYSNILKFLKPLGKWKGKSQTLSFPTNEIEKDGLDAFAIILQENIQGNPGEIFGAAVF